MEFVKQVHLQMLVGLVSMFHLGLLGFGQISLSTCFVGLVIQAIYLYQINVHFPLFVLTWPTLAISAGGRIFCDSRNAAQF